MSLQRAKRAMSQNVAEMLAYTLLVALVFFAIVVGTPTALIPLVCYLCAVGIASTLME